MKHAVNRDPIPSNLIYCQNLTCVAALINYSNFQMHDWDSGRYGMCYHDWYTAKDGQEDVNP